MKILVMTPERIDKMIASARGDCKEARIINDLNNGVPKYRIALGAHQSRLAQLLELRAAMTEVDLEELSAADLRNDPYGMGLGTYQKAISDIVDIAAQANNPT
uniref:Uncharacterized protein n=1 Tax=viral metagenome TaxID=1070528 RepID=A0A6M3KVS4_9ZZZZ